MARRYQSWGHYPKTHQQVCKLSHRDSSLIQTKLPLLPYGNGRSYGDSCLNDGGVLLDVRSLDRFIAFDPARGTVRCEAGVLLAELLELIVPRGWFLPVTPGTRFVTVGGAIANDVHGKNHHYTGTFGRHLRCFELVRSDGTRRLCSPEENSELFAATIGGLGLTGLIVWAEIALRPIANPFVIMETIRFANLDGFFELSAESDQDYEYTVAWIDCLATGRRVGRGLFMRGNHAPALCSRSASTSTSNRALTIPFAPPFSLINGLSLQVFNALYYHRQFRTHSRNVVRYEPFFYPLDGILEWNRMYGPRGFLQYQCVVPWSESRDAIREILERIADAKTGSFLSVLKVFGHCTSPGMLSFPRHGTTLALDFPNRGERTFTLLDRLDEVVASAGGAIYPAKDARMKGEMFRLAFPRWKAFSGYIDSAFSSSFWRRVTEDHA